MNKPSNQTVEDVVNSRCTYLHREDGIHVVSIHTADMEAIQEMIVHFKFIAVNFADEKVNRTLVESSVFRSPNIALIFRELRALDRLLAKRAKTRLALIASVTMFNTLVNALAFGLMRSGDKFRIFGSTEMDKAEAWLKEDQ